MADTDNLLSLIATSSPHLVIENIGPRIDDLTKAIAESNLVDKAGVEPPSYHDCNAEGLHQHTARLKNFAKELLSQSEPLTGKSKDSDDDFETESDSDDELEAKLALKALHRGIELCGARKYSEAESVLKSALRSARLAKLVRTNAEDVKRAEVKLAEAYLYQENWSKAEQALSTFTKSSPASKLDEACLAEAHYLGAQLCLARHDFENSQKFCRKAIRAQKRVYGKTHKSYHRSLVLLTLIFKTSGDNESAADYLKGVPLEYLQETKQLACARFSSEGSFLSIKQERKSNQLLEKDFGLAHCGYADPLGTAMRWAAAEGHKEVVQLLIWRGVKVDVTSIDGVTPLMSAVNSPKQDMIELLLEKGANIEQADNRGRTALLRAALYGNEDIIRLLLNRGANANVIDMDSSSVVLEASYHGRVRAISLFIEAGADVNLGNYERRTTLMYASREGHTEIVSLLLGAGADVSARDKTGCTALTRAAEYHRHDIVKLLVDASATINILDSQEHTPLMWAATANDVSSLRFLIKKGADITLAGQDGRTALWRAVDKGMTEAVRLLLENGADPNVSDTSNGNTPLLEACQWGYTEIVKLLLNHGADLDVRMYDRAPIEWANLRWRYETVELLKAYGATL